jgi:hypothetical protein
MVKQSLRRLFRTIKRLDERFRYYPSRRGYRALLNRRTYRLADGANDAPDGPTYLAALDAYRQLLDSPPKPPTRKPPRPRGCPKKVLPEWAVAAYQSGRSIKSVAKEAGIGVSTFTLRLRESGFAIRKSGRPKGSKNPALLARDRKIRKMRQRGKSLPAIAQKFGLTKQRVAQILA